jgi:hypothetical protein
VTRWFQMSLAKCLTTLEPVYRGDRITAIIQ